MLKVYPYEAIEIGTEANVAFNVNGSRLKQLVAGEPIEGKTTCALLDASSS